jgi:hypothetical protein
LILHNYMIVLTRLSGQFGGVSLTFTPSDQFQAAIREAVAGGYLSRYPHRVTIANRRLVHLDDQHVSLPRKDYRQNGVLRSKFVRLALGEFILPIPAACPAG